MIKFNYIHHSCFLLETENEKLLFDPFLDGNPKNIQAKDLKPNYILVSHAHSDHLGSAYEIAKSNNSLIISTNEIAVEASENGCNSHGMHIGGTYMFPFGKVRITPAFHGSGISGGHACGFIVHLEDKVIYFAGDTSLFGDMKLLAELENIDYAILPIGDNFTMGPKDAEKAVEFLGAKYVIPIHYNTWPIIKQNPLAFKKDVEEKTKAKVIVLNPGEKLVL
jgi:L-ascorbate metabolism protein UlaG (beta-lactamase superfamily)